MANLGYLQVTRRCNQCCLFCSNPELDVDLEPAEGRRRIREFAASGYAGVIFTGGEPTLYEALPELVAHAAEVGLPVRIVTNGQRLGSEPGLCETLMAAGLGHVHLSLYSHRREVVGRLTGVPESLDRALAALERLCALEGQVTVDLNTVINSANADHLDQLVASVITRFPSIRHVVFNNLDPFMNRVAHNPETLAPLWSFELSLDRAMRWLASHGRTFRVERVPLCYMSRFADVSTETRKIVKAEERTTHFLDDKGSVRQTGFLHHKEDVCRICRLDPLCAGLDGVGHGADPAELVPLFLSPEPIAARILGKAPESIGEDWIAALSERQRRVPRRTGR